MQPQLFPIIGLSDATGLFITGIRVDFWGLYYFVVVVIIIATIGGTIEQWVKASKFRVEDFYKK